MTATHVDGVPVIAAEPAQDPKGWKDRRTGEPLRFKQILRLLLEDGSETFGCIHCDYTNPSIYSVRPHLNKHRLTLAAESNGHAAGVDLAELARRLQRVDRLEADRDEWRRRALDAERELRKIRELLGGRLR